MKEPKFIREARQAIEQESEGRPDAATYAEAGNAALNIVLAHYLATPLLNPSIVADEKLAIQRAQYERHLQQAADNLAAAQQRYHALEEKYLQVGGEFDKETGLPYREALTRTRDKLRSTKNELKALQLARESGVSVQAMKQTINPKYQHVRDENLRLARRVIELELKLAANEMPLDHP